MQILLCLLPCLLGAGVCVAWGALSAASEAMLALVLLLGLLVLSLAVRAALRPAQGLLAWDGQSWSWEDGRGRCVGRIHVRLDWQQGLLLEFRPLGGRPIWLWAERERARLSWDGLRRALRASPAASLQTGSEMAA